MIEQSHLERAKLLEKLTITKEKAVESFGTIGQQQHFSKHKYFKNKKVEEALIKTLNQLFESVEKIKNGRRIDYKLGPARNQIAERESNVGNRGTNGNWKEYTKHLDALILAQLEWVIKNKGKLDKTAKQWMYEFGIINDNHLSLTKMNYSPEDRQKVENIIKDANVCEGSYIRLYKNEKSEIKEFFYQDYLNKKRTFMSTLKRLAKEEIIKLYELPIAYIAQDKGEKKEPVTLSSESYQDYIDKQKELLEKYNLELYMLSRENQYQSQKSIESQKRNVLALEEYSNDPKRVINEEPPKDENEIFTAGDEIYFRMQEYNKEMSHFLKYVFTPYTTERNPVEEPINHIVMHLAIISTASNKKTMNYLNKYSPEVLSDYLDFKKEKEKYIDSQEGKYRKTNRAERLATLETKKQKDLRKAEERDIEMSFDGITPTRHSMDEVEVFYKNLMNAVSSLEEIFKEDFRVNEKIIKKNKEQRE